MPDIYQPPMTALPHATFVELWPMALSELRHQMTKATFNAWLADSYVLAPISSLSRLIIAVPVCPGVAHVSFASRHRPYSGGDSRA